VELFVAQDRGMKGVYEADGDVKMWCSAMIDLQRNVFCVDVKFRCGWKPEMSWNLTS
jgi:hypothetical protein